jgi:hypothetical protein
MTVFHGIVVPILFLAVVSVPFILLDERDKTP